MQHSRPTATIWYWVACLVGIVAGEWRAGGAGYQPEATPSLPIPAFLEGLVARIREAPLLLLGASSPVRPIIDGVAFGRTDDIANDVKDTFLVSGLWHLLAASGQNIALVIGMCIVAAWLCGMSKTTGVLIAIAAVPLYAMIVGGGASIMRASIMGEAALAVWLVGYRKNAMTLCALSAAVLVWVWPGSHRQLGTQLSYACVLGLMTLHRHVIYRWPISRMPHTVAQGSAATIICATVTAPILLMTVGSAPMVGGLANLIAVPLAGIILIGGVAASLIALVSTTAATPVMLVVGLCAHVLSLTAAVAAALPLASARGWLAWMITMSAVLWIAWPQLTERYGWLLPGWIRPSWIRRQPRHIQLAALVALTTCLLVAWHVRSTVHQTVWERYNTPFMIVMDVGQGDAILLGDPATGATILIDTGKPEAYTGSLLTSMGVNQLSGIVITHPDDDHAGGLSSLIGSHRPGWIGAAPGIGHDDLKIDDTIELITLCERARLDGLPGRLAIHAPACGATPPAAANDHSIVASWQTRAGTILLTGDAESNVLSRIDLPVADILKVPHHGSRDDGLASLLNRVHPHTAIISVGDNRYGHPHPSVLNTLARHGIATHTTRSSGHVRVQVLQEGLAIG